MADYTYTSPNLFGSDGKFVIPVPSRTVGELNHNYDLLTKLNRERQYNADSEEEEG